MSSCLSGGCRPYGFDLEIVKSPSSTSTITTHSSSPTLSESSNSPLAISTRKPRTPRKRPNQTYNEAAALLSTAYPKIFPAKHLTTKNSKFNTQTVLDTFLTSTDSPDLLLPFRVFDNSGFLLHQPIQEKPGFRIEPRVANCYEIPVEDDHFLEDFDAESILDEEIEEGGVDSILGNLSVENDESNGGSCSVQIGSGTGTGSSCYGFPMGLGFGGKLDFLFGMKRGVRALRNVDEGGDWWRFPSVNVNDISPKLNKAAAPTEKKKKKKIEKPTEVVVIKGVDESPEDNSIPRENDTNSVAKQKEITIPKPKILKLNYDEVANAWSDRGSPFSEEFPGQEQPGSDLHARLDEIDLFSENGGLREASVLRYKEKRRTRLFSKKIRYQVRKVNADRRPRMKGRFVRRPNSPMSDGG